MLFSWHDDTIRWYEAADKYTGFYKNLADTLGPMVDGAKAFADLGCGLGLIDLELAPQVESICCVDISEEALSHLRETAARRGISNLEIICCDSFELERTFDVIYLCFFSSQDIERFLPMCRKLIAIVSGESNAPFFPQQFRKKRRRTVEDEKRYLAGLGLGYTLTERVFEFGQPLTSIEDARAFVRVYAPEIPQRELDEFLELRLVETGDARYPLYMPRKKTIGIFEVDGKLK